MSLAKIMAAIEESYQAELAEKAKKLGITVEQLKKLEEEERKAKEEAERPIREAEQKRKEEENLKRKTEYKEKIGLGIFCEPSIILRWRVMHERSMGTGSTRSTRTHLRLLEPLNIGRIKRNAGDLLCSRKGRWDLGDQDFSIEIDCPKCVELLNRLKKLSK